MKKSIPFLLLATLQISCGSYQEKPDVIQKEEKTIALSPKEMLAEAYQLFKEGKDHESVVLAERVLAIGKETKNDTLIGRALTSLCRNAQRNMDTNRLAELSEGLKSLAQTSGNKKWMMYRAHQNAEMWRLVGNLERAEKFYIESMELSSETGSKGMFMIDHFNKSFVSTGKGDFEEAARLISKYYELRRELDSTSEDAYGLIALCYLLEQKANYSGAHEVALVTRRLFKEQNLFPEPPDEKPLLAVEAKVKEELSNSDYDAIKETAQNESVSSLLEKYLK